MANARIKSKSNRSVRIIAKLIVGLMILEMMVVGCGTEGASKPTATPVPEPVATATKVKLEQDYWPTNNWKASTPEEQGIDSAGLLMALQKVEDAGINLRSMTVIKNGYVVMEAYRQPFVADMKVQVHSVTKTVIGVLTGIAIDEGYIKSVDDRVLSYFPEMKPANMDELKASITIRDLITLTPGLDCADDALNGGMERSTNWVKYVLDLPMKSAPGKELVYCTAGVHLMSAVLTRATGMSTKEYAQAKLFGPLGIRKDSFAWPADPQGITQGGYGLEIRPLDVAKIGLLYLNDGVWAGKQVVSKGWVEASRSVQSLGGNNKNYGYLWWVYPTHYAMEGYGEQKVMVVPDNNLVVVMTAAIDWHKGQPLEGVLKDYVVKAVKSDDKLADNPAERVKLQAKISDWAYPVRPVAKLSETARRISGHTYSLETNPMGWREISMYFVEASNVSTGTILSDNGLVEVTTGLDNVYRIKGPMDSYWEGIKGTWMNENTFAGREIQANPDAQEEEISFVFEGEQVKIHVEEVVMATITMDIVGVMKK